MSKPEEPRWRQYPEAEAFVQGCVEKFVSEVPEVQAFKEALFNHTGSRFVDWLDHLVLSDGENIRAKLHELGFEKEDVPAGANDTVYYHPGAVFPRLLLRDKTAFEPGETVLAAIHLEDISNFLMTHQVPVSIEGTPLSPFRRAKVWERDGREFLAIERRGHSGFVPVEMPSGYPHQYLKALEKWNTRPRSFNDTLKGMKETKKLAQSLVDEMGVDTAAWIAFEGERFYWHERNRAAKIQKARQDALGLGFGNHDHHTFRSSRKVFTSLIEIFETLGFHLRERFYAGAQAGWGAQLLEQPTCRIVIFADVDLGSDEVLTDFTSEALPPKEDLGTVGLWCALHGESMLDAGMHHLACKFDFDALKEGIAKWGIKMLDPFSDFPFLKQAFTGGERWDVPLERLEELASEGKITGEQKDRLSKGAIGSHMENIQRGDGFKGFNQEAVSDIIRRTDPRTGHGAA